MGERNNGCASCDLRRGQRGAGAYNGRDNGYRRGRGVNERSGGCDERDNGCGICRLFGSLGEDGCGCGGQQRNVNGREGRDGCGCGAQQRDVNDRNRRSDRDGCGCGCACGCGSDRVAGVACAKSECHTLMRKLQRLDFSIQETVLYLDAYPSCCEALARYRELVKERCEVAKQYESSCGPLTAHGNGSAADWNWVEPAWPWHHEFPGNHKA